MQKYFQNKTIFLTGGTGSFGKVFALNILKNYKPKKLIIFSRDELKQYEFKQKIGKYKNVRFFIGDIRELDRLVLATKDVDIIVHAAALKQVDTAEYNPFEFVKTNILGAQNIIEAALQNKVNKVIALSTDKAVNPINLYGATKLAADKLIVAANNLVGSENITFSVVRYGNVMDSRGSIIPLYKKILNENKNSFPLTHLDMTRFFVSLDDSVRFVIKSICMMKGGEIFIPKLVSFRIKDFILAISKNPKIIDIGIRPGEKMYETLISTESYKSIIEFKNHYVVMPSIIFFKKKNYKINSLKEKGKLVTNQFEYSSKENKLHLTKLIDIKNFLKKNDNSLFKTINK